MTSTHKIQNDLVRVGTQCELAKKDCNNESFIGIDLNKTEFDLVVEKTLIETKNPFNSQIDGTDETEATADISEMKDDLISSLPDVTSDKDKAENGVVKITSYKMRAVKTEERPQKKDPVTDLILSAPMFNLNEEPTNESSSPSSRVSCMSTEFSVVANEPPRPTPTPITTDITDAKPRVYPLLLMGCRNCLIYTMVPENDPHCPLCKKAGSVDEFRGSPKKKMRRGM